MCGSATVAQRRHIGLQQLETIAATTHGFLGPNKRPKLFQDEDAGDAMLVCSCSHLLECIELDGSVGQLLLQTVQAQQKLFHSRTAALVFLAGVWILKERKLQSKNTENAQNRSLDIQKLVTCLIPGLSEEFHGFVTLLTVEQASVVRRLQGQALNIALVNGDLCKKYRHVGFNKPGNVMHITDRANMSGVSLEELLIEDALRKLHEFSIDVVLVSSMAGVKLKDRVLGTNVLVIEGVKSSVLKDFSTCTGALLISYVTQIDENCVGQGVTVSQQRDFSRKKDFVAVSIVTASTSLVTAVISSSVSAKLQSLEDQFWSCAHRLHQALADGKLLHGAGTTELLCIQQLHQSKQTDMENPQESVVLELMAEAWMDYVSTLMMNSRSVGSKAEAWTAIAHQMRLYKDGEAISRDADGAGVYDNVTVKSEAWRRALDLVFLVLQSDTEIITGVSEGENVYRELMYL
ncbi:Bardet-Biedl syndrome 12 protein-like [Sinocyclocheilus anshuiensis]|uniref:Bardet-Biedl syndrome 12 protein-like n=1 Tax=Sinocyclocheilus anshuiensis TaxID=1608454 RepID=UPI0007BA847F|nr:PREDICTED: Bardet-Biedl syndrome 12 protein-like [Sinocyclocheilus anshuiensis]